jgi:ribosomal protein L37E
MVRQERCPQCGSKKITVENLNKKCKICGFQWSAKARKETARKDKVRF